MSETLIGVLVGGILSGLGTWITIITQHKQWILKARIERLSEKREKLETAYEKTLNKLLEGMNKGIYSSDMMSDIDFLFPEIVSNAFEAFMAEDSKSERKMKHHYYDIARAMKQSLNEIDRQVDLLVLDK